jgi:hypothetical protein
MIVHVRFIGPPLLSKSRMAWLGRIWRPQLATFSQEGLAGDEQTMNAL